MIYIIVLWVVCGVITWGAFLGDWYGKFGETGDIYCFASSQSLLGPLGLLSALFCTNIFEHGFKWR